MSLEIVIGPMFSGKSTYALSYIRRQRAIGRSVVVIKPDIDNRYSSDSVLVTHDREQVQCIMWNTRDAIGPTELMKKADCVVLEEAQFFTGLKTFVPWFLRVYKKNILVVGLDGDAKQNIFGEILDCIPWATSVTKLNALCSQCNDGTLAPYSKKIVESGDQVDVGGADKYEAVCLKHLLE